MKGLYAFLRLMNDINAICKGSVGGRIRNKAIGRIAGKAMKKRRKRK